MSYLEKWLDKIIPDILNFLLVPAITLIVMTPLMLCDFGPLGYYIGIYI